MAEIEVLCVGGRHDGLRKRLEYNHIFIRTFLVVDSPELPVISFDNPTVLPPTLSYETYIVECIHSGARKFWIGRPPNQSVDSTVALLIQGYRGV